MHCRHHRAADVKELSVAGRAVLGCLRDTSPLPFYRVIGGHHVLTVTLIRYGEPLLPAAITPVAGLQMNTPSCVSPLGRHAVLALFCSLPCQNSPARQLMNASRSAQSLLS